MGIGSDVGAGTTFSMLRTLGEAYKVAQLQSYRLRASEAFYHATLGGAARCRLDDKIGNFQPGKEADFVVIDPGDAAAAPAPPLSGYLRAAVCADDAGRRTQYHQTGQWRVRLATAE
jgi:cytosine/adenosine deaminase-related metal-dependent hydrolase